MIKLFIFDMGGVLARNVNILPEAASILGLEEKTLLSLVRDDLQPLMEGRLDTARFWKRFEERSGIRVRGELWGELFSPRYDRSTDELIRGLQELSVPVVCGTNTLEEHYRIHLENGDYSVFDRVYASHLMGVAKPDHRFFSHILEKEKVRPDEAVFTDDFPENVEAARQRGIHSFLFTDASTLASDLSAAGLAGLPHLSPFLN